MNNQWERINERLIQLEEQTRVKVAEKDKIIQQITAELDQVKAQMSSGGTEEILKEYQAQIATFDAEKQKMMNEITGLNQQISNLQSQLQSSAASVDQTQAIQEQLGVFQEMIRQLEAEKRDLMKEIQEMKETPSGSAELEQTVKEYQEIIKQLEAEKVKAELKAVKSDAVSGAEPSAELQKLEGINSQLQEEKELLEAQIADLKKDLEEQANQLSQVDALRSEKDTLLQQVKTLELQIQTQSSGQQQLETLQNDNQNLKASLDKTEKELDDLVRINREQAEKIAALESTLAPPTPAPTAPAPAPAPVPAPVRPAPTPAPAPRPTVAPGGVQYFKFSHETFLRSPSKPQGIILELDQANEKWILTIEPGTSFLQKNNALRAGRALSANGWPTPEGRKIGKGYEIIIHGEY